MRSIAPLVFICAIGLAGCQSILPNPTGGTEYLSSLNQYEITQVALESDLQHKNRILQLISNGNYACGDPKSKQLQTTLAQKDITKYVAKDYDYKAKKWANSLGIISSYIKTLNEIDDTGKKDETTINELESVVAQSFQDFGLPVEAGIVTSSKAFLYDIYRAYQNHQKEKFAQKMILPLHNAVSYLENSDTINTLTEPERAAFASWDECARETIYYMIALSDPTFNRKYGVYTSNKLFPVPPPTVGEIKIEWDNYISSRQKYTVNASLKKPLDALLKQNADLANGGAPPTFDDLKKTFGDFCSVVAAVKKNARCPVSSDAVASKNTGAANTTTSSGGAGPKPTG